MYRNSKKDRTEFFRQLNESFIEDEIFTEDNVDLKSLSNYSNPGLDIITWRGEGEMPTTVKGADMDDIAKKIAAPYGEDLKATEVFEAVFDEVFGKGEKSYRPFEVLEDDFDMASVIQRDNDYHEFIREEADEDKEEDSKDDKSFSADMDKLKQTNDESSYDEDDDDDDDDDEEDSLNESFLGLNLDEDYQDDYQDALNEDANDYDMGDVAPLSLLENNELDIVNLDTLLEQTQLIEDELDQVSNYDSVLENDSDFSDVFDSDNEMISEDTFDESFDMEDLLEDGTDYSEYLDEDIL
jgi:hypothetical protein